MAKDTNLNIRINSDLKKQAQQHAKETGRTLAGLIEWLLKQELKKHSADRQEGKVNMETLVGKEMKLMELNETMQELTGSNVDIFDYGREDWENFSWYIEEEDFAPVGKNVEFEILNPEENDTKLIVKVLGISEL